MDANSSEAGKASAEQFSQLPDAELLQSNGLPAAFSTTKVLKKKGAKRSTKRSKPNNKRTAVREIPVDTGLENFAEEFRVAEVLRSYRNPFTVLMSLEERVQQEEALEVPGALETSEAPEILEPPQRLEPTETLEAPETSPPNMHRYYQQRYDLFSLFDDGIDMGPGDEGWWSVTPEAIAAHTASEARAFFPDGQGCVVMDAFCGLGGNAIQFALAGFAVIAVELDKARLEAAKHNAQIYGVADQITFVHGDAFEVLQVEKNRHVDLVFMSPPWGGPLYAQLPVFDPCNHLFQGRGEELFKLARALTPYVVYFLPRQTNLFAIARLLSDKDQDQDQDSSFVVEQHYLRNRLKAISIYFYP